MKTETELTQLIEEHWAYIESLLRAHGLEAPDINLAAFHYKTAFRHGYKHAMEEKSLLTKSNVSPEIAKAIDEALSWSKPIGAVVNVSGVEAHLAAAQQMVEDLYP